MVAVLAGLKGFLYALMIGKLSQRFPGLTVVGYASRLMGRWVGKSLGVILGLLLACNAAVDLRVMLRSVVGVYYSLTPAWAIALMMAVVALTLTWFGIATAGRMGPLLVAALFVTFAFSFPWLLRWLRPGYLSPLFNWSAIDPLSDSFWSALGSERSGIFLAALMPYIREPKRAVRAFAWGYWLGWAGAFLAVIVPIMLFSVEGARTLSLPFPTAIAVIRLANFPIERMEMLLRIGYSLNILVAVALQYFSGGLLLSEVFGSSRTRPFMLGIVALSLLPGLLWPGEANGRTYTAIVLVVTMFSALLVYGLLWAAYWFAARRKPHSASPSH